MRQRLQVLHGRQHGNLHHLLQLEGRAITARNIWLGSSLVDRDTRRTPTSKATARSVLKIKGDILDRAAGVEAVLHAIFLAKGNTDIALARPAY